MDKETRNRIQRATQAARVLLEREYAEQLGGIFDIRLDGSIGAEPGSHLGAEQRVLRTKLVAAVDHQRASELKPADAVAGYLREAAFTMLNRIVALKMLEARGLVQECVSRGDQSAGFKEFTGLAPGLVQVFDHGYRLYIESLFDEIGRDVRILFDRRDPASLLWPRRQTVLDLLAILNASDLVEVWKEDETVGWFYQYFNGDEERRQMRAESQAPRNGRELAVRNQFFTPRYVVEFLTDNTLGRIWYEMRQGKTHLVDRSRYLVRRPNEVFLILGQNAPQGSVAAEAPSQEELLKETIYIPCRAKKDPRDLKILDPACGSGHFLLYAFDLLLAIYEEGWEDNGLPPSELTGRRLREDYSTLDELRRAIPGVILRYNLYGIDIDARAAQIAALALWMRTQRASNELGIARGDRLPITKTNIVVAEPMPGERELRQDFIASLDPKLGRLVERVFDKMELAGEAGFLLRIDDEIKLAIRELYGEMGTLFRLSDEERWRQAESELVESLQSYMLQVGQPYLRRQFAEDALRGLAFIDVCRTSYDVVLMNPPFGLAPARTFEYLRTTSQDTFVELYASFVRRGLLAAPDGLVGAITSRGFMTMTRLTKWRTDDIVRCVDVLVDLGGNVMDSAFVASCAYVLRASPHERSIVIGDVSAQSEIDLQSIAELRDLPEAPIFVRRRADFRDLPDQKFIYRAGPRVTRLFRECPTLEGAGGIVRTGLTTFDDERFLRLWWEVPDGSIGQGKKWELFSKGGDYAKYFSPVQLVINREGDGAELAEVNRQRNGQVAQSRQGISHYYKPGLTFTSRSAKGVSVRALPAGCVISHNAPTVYPLPPCELDTLLGWMNSRLIKALIEIQATADYFTPGSVKKLPWMDPGKQAVELARLARRLMHDYSVPSSIDERSLLFAGLPMSAGVLQSYEAWLDRLAEVKNEIRADQRAASDIVDMVYGIESTRLVEDVLEGNPDEDIPLEEGSLADFCTRILLWGIGTAFGRWKRGTDGRGEAGSDGFAALPIRSSEVTYRPDERSILVDDAGHRDDLVGAIESVFPAHWDSEVAWRDLTSSVVANATGVDGLRQWARSLLFECHIKEYSRSRRRAPIYWQIATPSASYSVWLYYHHLTTDTLYKVLNEYVFPKLQHEERRLRGLVQAAQKGRSAEQRKEIAEQEMFVEELRTFRDELSRIAPLWNPDLNDGVVINFAPLWRLVPQHGGWQKECKDCWGKLVAGDYDWAHLGMHLWPERVVRKCAEDRSLAIAHGLEGLFWVDDTEGKRKVDQGTIRRFGEERASPAVKAALKSLVEAPTQGSRRGSRRTPAPRGEVTGRRAERTVTASAPLRGAGAEAGERVREAIAKAAGGASKGHVLAATGITDVQWNAAISTLLSQGLVTKSGERRGARYHIVETEDRS